MHMHCIACIMHCLIDNNLFSSNQYGFRAQHSTELATLNIVDRLTYLMDQDRIQLNIYIDLLKAFDTLNFEILLDKLAHYGVLGKANSLIQSYLTNRKQSVINHFPKFTWDI